jgi:predicted dehydrogenase
MNCVLVGLSGYGNEYVRFFESLNEDGLGHLTAIVDPYAATAPRYAQMLQRGIPIFDSLSSCFQAIKADLVIMSSPIAFHKEQVIQSIEHGAYVLCEKPLVPRFQDLLELKFRLGDEWKKLGVGFQWSFSSCMQSLKRKILARKLGKPLMLKTHISWQRLNSYYTESSWHGRIRDARNEWVLDSILTNATAHYLHNIFFLLGDTMTSAAMPTSIQGSVYRGKNIESYDTCFLKGTFPNGASFLYIASHAGDRNSNPKFEYIFEKATVTFDQDRDSFVRILYSDGKQEICGEPQSLTEASEKLRWMMRAASNGDVPACAIQTITPHLLVSNAIHKFMPINTFPVNLHVHQENPPSLWIKGLSDAMETCYQQEKLPNELCYAWAAPSVEVPLASLYGDCNLQ